MFPTILLTALLAGQANGPGEGNPPAPDSIPAINVSDADGVPAPIVPNARIMALHPTPLSPMAATSTSISSATAGSTDRSSGSFWLRPHPELVALLQRAEAVTLPVNPAPAVPPPPAPPAPPKPSPQTPTAAVMASPQTQALTAPVAAQAVVQLAAVASEPVYPGPLRRAVGRVGEGLSHLGQPRVYYPRQPRPRPVAAAAPAPQQVVYVPVAQAPTVQPVYSSPAAPGKGLGQ